MEKKNSLQAGEAGEKTCSPTDNAGPLGDVSCQSVSSETYVATCQNVYSETYVATCRVCQCTEPDSKGNNALGFLCISPPSCCVINGDEVKSILKVRSGEPGNGSQLRLHSKGSELVEFISPTGEILVCTADLESGLYDDQDKLIELGCACKNDLAVAHYACALRWFINHGSTVCEICGSTAKNIRHADFKKVLRCLKDYDALRERILNGDPSPAPVRTDIGIDPDAVAAIRSQRLSEIALWFNPHSHSVITPLVVSEQPQTSNIVLDEITHVENRVTKWAVESTGILLATGLLTVTLAWLLAPHVGKRTAKMGLHILLGGLCALTVVIFFRFFVLTRIKYGPARYWAILFVFWFLVFGIWASRTHGAHST